MIRTRIIEPINTPQDIVIPGGISGAATLRLGFEESPSEGTVTIERRESYQGDWVSVASGLDVTGDPVQVRFDGGANLLRVTFTGLVGGVMPAITIIENETATPPSWLMTDGGFGPSARLRVDTGQTGFFARRMWEFLYEFTALAATPVTFRFIIPCNFILHHSRLSVDEGGVSWRTYAESQGTPGGTFSTEVPFASANTMTEAAEYEFLSSIATGGTFTPTVSPPVTPLTLLRVLTAGSTAQQSSVGGDAIQEKGRSGGFYYGTLARMEGVSGDCKGTLVIVVEERP